MLSAQRGCRGREEAGEINCDFAFAGDGKRPLKRACVERGLLRRLRLPNSQGLPEELSRPRREECCGIDWELLQSALQSLGCLDPGKNNSIPENVEY